MMMGILKLSEMLSRSELLELKTNEQKYKYSKITLKFKN